MRNEKNINIVSGLICTGKSRILKLLRQQREFHNAYSLRLDDVGVQYWGKHANLTKHEKVFRNEVMRFIIKQRLVIYDTSQILLEMPMLTRAYHQEPFVDMIRDTQRQLRLIEPERVAQGRKALDGLPCFVNLNVVLLYCDIETVRKRIERKVSLLDTGNNPVIDMTNIYDTALQFEMPKSYYPLLINTSDESPEAEQQRLCEITAFFHWGRRIDQKIAEDRLCEAHACLDQLQQRA